MKTVRFSFLAGAVLVLLSSTALAQQTPDQKAAGPSAGAALPLGQPRPMTAAYAKRLVAAAIKSSCSPPKGMCTGAFAIADDAGVLVYLETLDGVTAPAPALAIEKARTPALWRRPTQVFLDSVSKGTNTSYADGSYEDMTTSPGGIPIVANGRIVGGYGAAFTYDAGKQIGDAVLAEAEKIFGKP